MDPKIKCINIEEQQDTLTIVFLVILTTAIFIGIWYRFATTWSSWSNWSNCSGGCGGFDGKKTRIRVCPTMMCEGDSLETEKCFTAPCQYDQYLNAYADNDNVNVISAFQSKTIEQLKEECGKEKECVAFTTRRPMFEKGRTAMTDPDLHEGYLLKTVSRVISKTPSDAIERRFYVKKPRSMFDKLNVEWVGLNADGFTNTDVFWSD